MNPAGPCGAADRLTTRRSLLQRLRNWRDAASWDDFARTYSRFLRSIALKSGLSEFEADDVVQETMISVAREIPKFNYDPSVGSFRGWLALITRRRIADYLRKRHYQVDGGSVPREQHAGTTSLANHPAPDSSPLEEQWQEEWSRSLLEAASTNVRARLQNLEFQMFYLHVMKQMSVPQVAAMLGVKGAQVYFAKYKVGAMMRREIRRLERQLL